MSFDPGMTLDPGIPLDPGMSLDPGMACHWILTWYDLGSWHERGPLPHSCRPTPGGGPGAPLQPQTSTAGEHTQAGQMCGWTAGLCGRERDPLVRRTPGHQHFVLSSNSLQPNKQLMTNTQNSNPRSPTTKHRSKAPNSITQIQGPQQQNSDKAPNSPQHTAPKAPKNKKNAGVTTKR